MATALQIISIILSSVALIVTGIGFFALLKFYRDGKRLSGEAEKALARIDERAEDLKSQMGQRFDRTLAAALGDHVGQDETGQALPSESTEEKALPEAATHENGGDVGDENVGDESAGGEERDEVFRDVQRYMSLRDLRLSTINDSDTQAFYDIGKNEGFNLFEGDGVIIYFGAFDKLDEEEIIIRVRNILKNIYLSYKNAESHPDENARNAALKALSNISIEILVSNDVNKDRVEGKIDSFKDEFVDKPVRVISLEEMSNKIEEIRESIVS